MKNRMIFLVVFFAAFTIEILCLNPERLVYVIPPSGFENDKLFDINDVRLNRDNNLFPFYYLRKCFRDLGYELKTTRLEVGDFSFKKLIVFGKPKDRKQLYMLNKCPKEKKVLILLEPPTVEPEHYDAKYHEGFEKVFIMLDDYVDNKKHFKLFYPQPSIQMIDDVVSFDQKKLCTMIFGNKSSTHHLELYSKRREIIRFFENHAPDEFDLYGVGWEKANYPLYKGPVSSKKDVLKNYKFCICYENMRDVNGYITEKIFDAFFAGCVPVYWGAKNISQFIPKECFIAREEFESNESLYNYLKSISVDQYGEYITAIRKYLASSASDFFSKEYFAKNVIVACLD